MTADQVKLNRLSQTPWGTLIYKVLPQQQMSDGWARVVKGQALLIVGFREMSDGGKEAYLEMIKEAIRLAREEKCTVVAASVSSPKRQESYSCALLNSGAVAVSEAGQSDDTEPKVPSNTPEYFTITVG